MEGFNDRIKISMPFSAAYVGDYTDKVGYYILHGIRPNFPLVESESDTVSFSKGFSASESARVIDGVASPSMIEREKLNQFAYICTLGAYRNLHGRIPRFNEEYSSAIGGYPKGAILRCSSAVQGMSETVVSMQDNNTVNPDTYEIGKEVNGKVWWKYVRIRKPKSMPRILPKCDTSATLSREGAKKVVGQRFAYSGRIVMRMLPMRLIGAGENMAISDSIYSVNPDSTQVPLLSPCELSDGEKKGALCVVSE